MRKQMNHLVTSRHIASRMAKIFHRPISRARIFLPFFFALVMAVEYRRVGDSGRPDRPAAVKKKVTTHSSRCPFFYSLPGAFSAARVLNRGIYRGLTSTERYKAIANSYIS